MKKALVIAAVVLASASAHAAKARLKALGESRHLNDVRDVLVKPDKAAAYGDWLTLEFGPESTAGGTTNAEGGFVRTMGQSALGVFLGAPSASGNASRTLAEGAIGGSTTFLRHENPINVFYANKMDELSWGVGLYHSSSKRTLSSTADRKQEAMSLTASASTDVWDAQLAQGLSSKATDNNGTVEHEVKGKSSTTLRGGYKFDTMYAYAEYGMTGVSADQGGGSTVMDLASNTMKIGIVNSHKQEGTDFFYGIEYSMLTRKDDAENPTALGAGIEKVETTSMPIFVGIEAEATPWLVLRGSFTQSLNLLGMAKTKTSNKGNSAADTETTGVDNSTVAVGAGIKWGKFTFDSIVAAGANGDGALGTDGTHFLTHGSLTYNF